MDLVLRQRFDLSQHTGPLYPAPLALPDAEYITFAISSTVGAYKRICDREFHMKDFIDSGKNLCSQQRMPAQFQEMIVETNLLQI